MMKHLMAALTVLGLALGAVRSSSAQGEGVFPPARIVVSIPPLEWLARELAPEAEVTLLAQPGSSPHSMELTPGQVYAIAKADVVLAVGFNMEMALDAALRSHENKKRVVVTFEATLANRAIEDVCLHHDEAGHDEHVHGPADPHMWLDPLLMSEFAAHVGEALKARFKESGLPESSMIDARLAAVQQACTDLDDEYRTRLLGVEHRSIVTHHNAYGYLARRYGLEVAAVIQPFHGVEPTPGALQSAAQAIRDKGVPAIFVEPQFSARAAERLSQMTGVKTIQIDPLGSGDYPKMMRENLSALVEGLGGD